MQKKILKFLKDENENLKKEIEDLKKEIKKLEDKISGVDKLSIDEDEIKEMDKKVEGWFW